MRRNRLRRTVVLVAVAAAAAVAAGAADAAARTCSAAGLAATPPKQALPAKVARTRARIVAAAVRCDYAALAAIARENPRGFKFTYGGETSAAAYWRRLEARGVERPLARLVQILSLPGTKNEIGWPAWPSAYRTKPSAADWNALVRAGVYTRAEATRMKQGGSYLGYRTAISREGRWQFFVAGD